MRKLISISLALFCLTSTTWATETSSKTVSTKEKEKVAVVGGVDIVSAYIWRGVYNAGASFQPTLKVSYFGFSLGAWGSTDFIGQGRKEVDLSLSYTIKGFTVGVTDYWWDGEGAFNYFRYKDKETPHRWEGNLSYQLPVEKFPLVISWNTMFAGNDYNAAGNRAYSTYIELNYPFSIGSVAMSGFVGATPWTSPSILPSTNEGFSVCNVGVGALKEFKLSKVITLPVFAKLMFNPALDDVHFVFGLSLYFNN